MKKLGNMDRECTCCFAVCLFDTAYAMSHHAFTWHGCFTNHNSNLGTLVSEEINRITGAQRKNMSEIIHTLHVQLMQSTLYSFGST